MYNRLLAVAPPRRERTSTSGRRAAPAVCVIAGAALGLLTGCQDNATSVTGPPPSATVASPLVGGTGGGASTQPHDVLSRRLSSTPGSCVVAVRAPEGGYLSRSVAVPLPAEIASSGGGTTRFAYRGWAAGAPEPVLLAVCTIPDGPAARAYFETHFGGKSMNDAKLHSLAKSAGVARVQEWGPTTSPGVMQGAQPVYMTDGLASQSPATRSSPRVHGGAALSGGVNSDVVASDASGTCDPNAIIPEPGCEGWTPESETVPDTPPPPSPDPSTLIIPIADLGPAPDISQPSGIYCAISTDDPHLSTTAGFAGNINAKAKSVCTVPMYHFVQATLKRESCFLWIFCNWSVIAQSRYENANALTAITPASATCAWQDGWYVAEGYHVNTYLGETHASSTSSAGVRIQCW